MRLVIRHCSLLHQHKDLKKDTLVFYLLLLLHYFLKMLCFVKLASYDAENSGTNHYKRTNTFFHDTDCPAFPGI